MELLCVLQGDAGAPAPAPSPLSCTWVSRSSGARQHLESPSQSLVCVTGQLSSVSRPCFLTEEVLGSARGSSSSSRKCRPCCRCPGAPCWHLRELQGYCTIYTFTQGCKVRWEGPFLTAAA